MVIASYVAFCELLGEKFSLPRYMYIVDREGKVRSVQIRRADTAYRSTVARPARVRFH